MAKNWQEVVEMCEAMGLGVTQQAALAKSMGIDVPQEVKAMAKANKRVGTLGLATTTGQPNRLYLTTPSVITSDGKQGRGLFLEVAGIRQILNDMNEAVAALEAGELTHPDFNVVMDAQGNFKAVRKG